MNSSVSMVVWLTSAASFLAHLLAEKDVKYNYISQTKNVSHKLIPQVSPFDNECHVQVLRVQPKKNGTCQHLYMRTVQCSSARHVHVSVHTLFFGLSLTAAVVDQNQ